VVEFPLFLDVLYAQFLFFFTGVAFSLNNDVVLCLSLYRSMNYCNFVTLTNDERCLIHNLQQRWGSEIIVKMLSKNEHI